ncbi:hypothetical protein FB451DRAFT_1518065 [Mycena latifolia]|nr:hypothetical protein FB451DRAFT_1518065 [Mycena latifolia]
MYSQYVLASRRHESSYNVHTAAPGTARRAAASSPPAPPTQRPKQGVPATDKVATRTTRTYEVLCADPDAAHDADRGGTGALLAVGDERASTDVKHGRPSRSRRQSQIGGHAPNKDAHLSEHARTWHGDSLDATRAAELVICATAAAWRAAHAGPHLRAHHARAALVLAQRSATRYTPRPGRTHAQATYSALHQRESRVRHSQTSHAQAECARAVSGGDCGSFARQKGQHTPYTRREARSRARGPALHDTWRRGRDASRRGRRNVPDSLGAADAAGTGSSALKSTSRVHGSPLAMVPRLAPRAPRARCADAYAPKKRRAGTPPTAFDAESAVARKSLRKHRRNVPSSPCSMSSTFLSTRSEIARSWSAISTDNGQRRGVDVRGLEPYRGGDVAEGRLLGPSGTLRHRWYGVGHSRDARRARGVEHEGLRAHQGETRVGFKESCVPMRMDNAKRRKSGYVRSLEHRLAGPALSFTAPQSPGQPNAGDAECTSYARRWVVRRLRGGSVTRAQ